MHFSSGLYDTTAGGLTILEKVRAIYRFKASSLNIKSGIPPNFAFETQTSKAKTTRRMFVKDEVDLVTRQVSSKKDESLVHYPLRRIVDRNIETYSLMFAIKSNSN